MSESDEPRFLNDILIRRLGSFRYTAQYTQIHDNPKTSIVSYTHFADYLVCVYKNIPALRIIHFEYSFIYTCFSKTSTQVYISGNVGVSGSSGVSGNAGFRAVWEFQAMLVFRQLGCFRQFWYLQATLAFTGN